MKELDFIFPRLLDRLNLFGSNFQLGIFMVSLKIYDYFRKGTNNIFPLLQIFNHQLCICNFKNCVYFKRIVILTRDERIFFYNLKKLLGNFLGSIFFDYFLFSLDNFCF